MTIWIAIFYGILQGITEFLPVSSSGHLVLFNKIFGTSDDFVFFSVLLHFATLFAVVIVLWKDIKFLIKNPFSRPAKMIYIATIPTVVIVLLFKGFFEDAFSGNLLPICFVITAILLAATELFAKKIDGKKMSFKTAALVGVAQGIAVLPGISRSGASICTAVLCGVDRQRASRFSFIISIPIILASIAYELFGAITSGGVILDTPLVPTLFAFVAAFVAGLFCVKFMLTVFQKIKLWWFVGYLIIIAGVSLLV